MLLNGSIVQRLLINDLHNVVLLNQMLQSLSDLHNLSFLSQMVLNIFLCNSVSPFPSKTLELQTPSQTCKPWFFDPDKLDPSFKYDLLEIWFLSSHLYRCCHMAESPKTSSNRILLHLTIEVYVHGETVGGHIYDKLGYRE